MMMMRRLAGCKKRRTPKIKLCNETNPGAVEEKNKEKSIETYFEKFFFLCKNLCNHSHGFAIEVAWSLFFEVCVCDLYEQRARL